MLENELTSPIFDESEQDDIDPLDDIIDYLVRTANISFKNAHVNEVTVKTADRIQLAHELYQRSPIDFLMQFGKYLTPHHVDYFEKSLAAAGDSYDNCIQYLKMYHSETSRHKRVRNRRYKALQQLQSSSDYFTEKQMMLRNPLLYEQLVGQYLTDEEIRERDGADRENLTLLTMILDTVDRNHMTQMKNEQMLEESLQSVDINCKNSEKGTCRQNKQWGDFDTPDKIPSHKPEARKQCMISAPERRLLHEEFKHEMYSSFINGKDDFDYSGVDNNEQYDDLQQVSQDEEDRYFDSETNEVNNLEEHMALVQEYGRSSHNSISDDPLDVFMTHLSNKIVS